MYKKIVLITTGQPSCNPRIVKEAEALQNAGHDVTLIYCFFIQWASEKDAVLLKQVAWKYIMVGGNPTDKKLLYFLTRLRFKIAGWLSPFLGKYFSLFERAQARGYDEMLSVAKKIKADWYIGHNLGALAIAAQAAVHNGGKSGFDFEDYYFGENPLTAIKLLRRIQFIETKYLSFLTYYSCACSMIANAVEKDHPDFKGKVITLLNSFPIKQQPLVLNLKKDYDNSLQLFWFSQTVGKNRGLEMLLEALLHLNNEHIHVTLAGNCTTDMHDYLIEKAAQLRNNIHFVGVIQPEDLPTYSSRFDIGLALETGFSTNNDIALSNKIFTYLLAGNAIILSETAMQTTFNIQYKVGETFAINNMIILAQKINGFFEMQKLNAQKLHNYELAQNRLNWEMESEKLLAVIK